MQDHKFVIYFVVILLASSITLMVTIYTAIKKPLWSNQLIGLATLGAFKGALDQVIRLHFTLLAPLSMVLVVVILSIRLFLYNRKHHLG